MKRPYEHPICETFHVEHTRLLEVSIRHQDGDHPITVDSYDDSAAAEDLELESIIGVGSFGSNSTDNLDWTDIEQPDPWQ